ncbi:MAG: phage tail sheath subtilisin-like domain-containing protein [Pseudomonadota bacterium]
MAIQVDYPGVYIDEFQPAAPIQGASTSVAAFLGENTIGPPNKPTLITSWDAFARRYALPQPTPPEDTDHLWYAVRGFFANGGRTCYVTAITNATADSLELRDLRPAGSGGPQPLLRVSARRLGVSDPQIEVRASAFSIVGDAKLYAVPPVSVSPVPVAGATKLAVTNAERFLAGDLLTLAITAGTRDVTVAYTEPGFVHLREPLPAGTYSNPRLRFAALPANATSFRVSGGTGTNGPSSLEAGMVVTFSQNPGGGAPVITKTTVITAVRAERISAALTTYRVSVRDGLSGFTLDAGNDVSITSAEFKIELREGANVLPEYDRLSMSPAHPRYYANVINDDPAGRVFVEAIEQTAPTAAPFNRPTQGAWAPLGGGQAHNSTALAAGTEYRAALAKLAPLKDISIVAVPGRTDSVQGDVRAHCERLWDRIAVLDSELDADLERVQEQKAGLEDNKGFAALYYPWLQVISEKTGARILVPPSGYVAGIYARTDLTRGVFKAPAGTDCGINGAIGVETALSDSEQGIINLKGINVVRVFTRGGRPIVWGARTTSTDTNWQYVNIRRLFLFLEESIQTGIRGAVFEPNNQALWQRLKRTISAFLEQQRRDGALFGAKAEEAFYVRIDEALNPDNERALGRLYIEIGVRPSYPAEFIIVRIGIWQGGGAVSEA